MPQPSATQDFAASPLDDNLKTTKAIDGHAYEWRVDDMRQ